MRTVMQKYTVFFISFALMIFSPPLIAQFGGLGDAAKNIGIAAAKKKLTQQIGHTLGDGLPVKLDALHPFVHLSAPADFHPKKIDCTPQNMNTRLGPGDYTCEVRLYCQKDSVHAPSQGIAYEFASIQGPQAEALATLAFRAAAQNASPQTVQYATWGLEDGIPLNQLPPDQQALVQKLIPEYTKGFQSNPLQDIQNYYKQIPFLAKLMTFEQAMAQLGEVGQQVLQLEHAQQAIRAATFTTDRQEGHPIDVLPGTQPLPPPSTPETSPWSEIRPGVVGQLTIEKGYMQLNRLNFRVLPRNGGKTATIGGPRLIYASYTSQADLTLSDYVSIAEIFGSVVQPELAPELLTDAAKRKVGNALIGYAINHGAQAMLMMMANNGEGGGSKEPAKEESSSTAGKRPVAPEPAAEETSQIVKKALAAKGNQGLTASSKEAAEKAAADFVGSEWTPISDRTTGEVVGKISADEQRVVRYTSINKAHPYINLENKPTGGNLHLDW